MRKEDYKVWLYDKIENKPISDYISRCERVEMSLAIDLDNEYKKDMGSNVLFLLSYSKSDERDNLLPKCNIAFEKDANIYNGLSSLKTAVKKYFEFCKVN